MSSTETIDLAKVKHGQQAMWASGDYGAVAAMIPLVAERLVDSVNPAAGSAVLDVAGGTGNAAIAAARGRAVVTCTDYVPELLDRGRERAAAERLEIAFETADAEDLPYDDASYDAVLSVFGAMFAPDQAQTASELARVCKPGGRIGLASWTPDGFLGDWFRATARHAAPPAGLASPLRWGTEDGIAELLGDAVSSIHAQRRGFTWRFPSAQAMVDMFREVYGPTVKAFATVGPDGADALERDLLTTVERAAHRNGDAIAIPAEYLEVVAIRR
jgi:SAM-dependent methyltransferase